MIPDLCIVDADSFLCDRVATVAEWFSVSSRFSLTIVYNSYASHVTVRAWYAIHNTTCIVFVDLVFWVDYYDVPGGAVRSVMVVLML